MNENIIESLTTEELQIIPSRIVYLRKEILKMNQSDFASLIDISQAYLSQIESQTKPINYQLIQQISSKLRINPKWLINKNYDDSSVYMSATDSIRLNETNSLSKLADVFSLNSGDIDFISWYIKLPADKRKSFIDYLSCMEKLYKDFPL